MLESDTGIKRYTVDLTEAERDRLLTMIKSGRHAARQLLKARILLKACEGWGDLAISEALETSRDTVLRTRRRFVEEGLDSALTSKRSPNSARRRIFDGEAEAKLIALACSEPPKGHARWSLRLLEDKVVELHIVDRVSDNTIGRVLKKTSSSRT
jgi:Homeodomain-like domain